MNMHRTVTIAVVGLSAAASGCTQMTSLGISSEQIVGRDNAEVAEAPHLSALTIGADEAMMPNAYVGDLDGDGLDDILVGGMHRSSTASASVPDMTVYLFYGRAAFAEAVSAADADATFDSGTLPALALGDINGDGRADFMLGDGSGYELVFGSKERFAGHYAKFTAGVKWSYGEAMREGEFWATRFYNIHPLGDINGDGADDFSIDLTRRITPTAEPTFQSYLFEGRSGGWPSGTWDPSWAAASFAAVENPGDDALAPTSTGDFDGDGKSDIIATQAGRNWLFYGRTGGLHGALTTADADAELDTGSMFAVPVFSGDLDGDGADDLQVQSADELQVVYGSHARYSGVVQPAADLIFAGASGSAQAADLNADGLTDMVVTAHPAVKSAGPSSYDSTTVYQVRGNGARITGRYQLQPEQRYHPVGYTAPEALETGRFAFIDSRNDFDGDGSSDLMMVYGEVTPGTPDGAATVTMYLLPGNSRAPD